MSDTAAERLARILHILPAAHRPGGARLEELARDLDVDVEVILSDIETVTAREYYHPGGSVDGMCVRLESDRVVLEGAEFDRPARLSPGEALALHLGLHALAAACSDGRRDHVLRFAARIAAALVVPPAETTTGAVRERGPELEYEPDTERALLLGLGEDVLRGVLSDAIQERRAVELLYLKPGAEAPVPRRVAPQQLAYAEGRWYLLTRELEHGEPRIFRLDRTLDATPGEPAPGVVHERAWIEQLAASGKPYVADADEEVVVRYAPAIARWIAEHTGAAPEPDGSVVVRHHVADPRWIIRHVLGFAGAARIEGPATMREQVARRALELSA